MGKREKQASFSKSENAIKIIKRKPTATTRLKMWNENGTEALRFAQIEHFVSSALLK